MDLKNIITQTNSKAIYLIKQDGNILDFYTLKEQVETEILKEKTSTFNTTIFNMCSHFFKAFYNAELNEIILKSNTQNIVLIKYKQYIIALISNENLNISLIELILKKEFNH